MERGSSSQRLSTGTGSPNPCSDGNLRWQCWIGELHVKSQSYRPALVSLPHSRSRPPVCSTRSQFPSTRAHAGDSTRLSSSERARCLAAGLCLYCAATDHYIGTCPVRPPHPAWVPFNLNLKSPHFACYQCNSSLQIIPLQSLPSSTRAPRAISSRRTY